MILKCTREYKEQILSYIGSDYSKCLYLYLDILKYGFDSKWVKIWVDMDITKGKQLRGVILKYHTGMHIFSKHNNIDIEEIAKLIEFEKPVQVCAIREIICLLESKLSNDYESNWGYVKGISDTIFEHSSRVETAKVSDFHFIASVLCQDNGVGMGYSVDIMEQQLKERFEDNYGRNYIIRKDGRIVAHAGTTAETEKIVLVGKVWTDPHYRGQGYATEILKALCTDLYPAQIYLICSASKAVTCYSKMGFKTFAEWGKLCRKKECNCK